MKKKKRVSNIMFIVLVAPMTTQGIVGLGEITNPYNRFLKVTGRFVGREVKRKE